MVQWFLPLLDFDDRIVVTEVWMKLMPPQVFASLKPFMRKIIAKDWTELTQQVLNLDK